MSGRDNEVLLEYQRVGSFMKAIAIDPHTGTEVSVVGPASGSQALLTRTAINKLKFVLQKKAQERA